MDTTDILQCTPAANFITELITHIQVYFDMQLFNSLKVSCPHLGKIEKKIDEFIDKLSRSIQTHIAQK